jgi:ligand-binding sensor domain-containing protein
MLTVFELNAQVYPIRKYSAENGLAHSNVFRIMQDKKGFLWFSTNYGISLFNGKTFKNYSSVNGLSSNVVMSISELQDEKKLINTMGGIDVLSNDSIKTLKIKNGRLPTNVIYSKEYDNKVWLVALLKGFDLFCIQSDSIKKITIYNQKGEEARINKLEDAGSDGLVFISDKGLFSYKKESGILPFLPGLISQKVTSFKKDRSGNYWVGLDDRLLCISGNKIIYTLQLKFNSGVSDLLVDSRNNIWVSVPQLGIVLIQNGVATNITDKLGLKRILINNLYEDSEKNIWIATHGDGVYKVSTLSIINFFPETDKLNVYARALFLRSDNTVLAGSYGTVTKIEHDRLTALSVKSLKTIDYIYFLNIIGENLYIGIPSGLLIKNLTTGHENLIRIPGAISIEATNKDTIWIGGFQHMGYISNQKYNPLNSPALKGRRINSIVAGPNDMKYIGTDSGLYILHHGQCRKEDFTIVNNNKYINFILEDKGKRLWLATENGLLMKTKNNWRLFTEKDGLSHFKCNAIVEDEHQNIWIGTKNGLNRIDGRTMRITEHPTGLYPNEILSLLFDKNNHLVVGTVNGISIIKELGNEITTRPPLLYITGVTASEKKWTNTNNITLSTSDKKIIVDFIALSYSYPENVEYRYKVDNLSVQWNNTKNTSVEMPMLYPGNYNFMVQARVNGGEWGNAGNLEITMPIAFWKTSWFIFSLVIFMIVIFIYVTRWWLLRKAKNENKETELQSKMIHLRQQALGALINPHFIFNCLNSVQHYLNRNDKDLANRYLAQFGRLIRLTLEYAQEMYIPLTVEMERLNLYLELEKLRCGELLKYWVNVDEDLLRSNLQIPNMILQPYVENAIWHGIMPKESAGHLSVDIVKRNSDEIIITIEDDGLGIGKDVSSVKNTSGKRISVGMILIKERLELFTKAGNRSYDVKITDKLSLGKGNSGTIIELNFPVLPG